MRTSVLAVALAAVLSLASASNAATIQIELGGLNLGYDGQSIFDADPNQGDPDPLTSVNFLVDGVPAGPIFTNDIFLDVFIPDVTGIAVAGGSVISAVGGIFDLLLPGGDLLELDLGQATITYTPVAGVIEFVFGGALAQIVSQSLPFGLALGDPVTVSFSSQIDSGSLTDDGNILTGFTSSGTGEIRSNVVPEAAAWMLLLPGLALISVRRRA